MATQEPTPKKLPRMRDCRGKESTTLTLVTVAFIALVIKFVFAGITVASVSMPPMSAGEFGLAAGTILAIWLGREWTEKKAKL